jgi:hypothetical protein
MGFSQASPRFLLVDVGYGKDATFTKITGLLLVLRVSPPWCSIWVIKNICKPTFVFHRLNGSSFLVRRSVTTGNWQVTDADTGGSDSAYASTIATLQSDGLVGKLTFLEAGGASAKHSPRFRLPTLYVDNVFMTHQATPPPSATHHPPPLIITSLSPSHTTGGLPTPRSPPSVSTSSSGKLIDPNLASK